IEIRDGACAKTSQNLLDARDDVQWNVPYLRVALQSIEHLQPNHPGHVDVERDRIRTEFARCSQSRFTIELDDSLVRLVARHVEQNFGEVLIVLDYQHRSIAFVDLLPVIGDYGLRTRSALRPIL